MKTSFDNLKQLNTIIKLALAPNGEFNFNELYDTLFCKFLNEMEQTNQDLVYHGEGNVLNHTKLVLENLVKLPEYVNSTNDNKVVLFLAGLMHDVGKITRTKIENGRIVSPNHTYHSAIITRNFLWKELGLAGSTKAQNLRESVCFLIRYHSFPPFAIKSENAEYKTLKILANGELFPWFFAKNLYALEKADALGRICNDGGDFLNRVEYFKELCVDLGVYEKPFLFTNDYTKRAYFLGKTNYSKDNLYKNSWGEVILLSGLPGTGKDTFISKNYPTLPVVSLDNIREELKISPEGNQGKVIARAKELCKVYLRKKQPFIYNATNITSDLRSKQISLFEEYNASVKIIFLETEYTENLKRNANRKRVVPNSVIEKMLSRLEVPEIYESEKVEYIIT